ncbi:MAG TPA: ABC transporter ATP-binding protein [Lachnospiraceae bacterium]|nr:ABC transporter ATP-binding protein [Lachnospiraceae bacterium]
MNVLEVKDLVKKYEKFELKNVSFEVEEGTICGFIGRNGAGKTTTLKSLLNQVHPQSGSILFFGRNFKENELEIKKQIGFVSGGISFYPKKTLKTLTSVTKKFYENWDDEAYRHFMQLFSLDEEKKADQLSEGMKVKYLLTLAMSHKARFLILDEPTSGLDPVSRDELLDIFIDLVENEGVTILFSTHITSDLDKCADSIAYIKNGEIVSCENIKTFIGNYRKVKGQATALIVQMEEKLIGLRKHAGEFQAIIKAENTGILDGISGITVSEALLEDIMIHMEKE